MPRPLSESKIIKICISVLTVGQQKTADEYGASKQYIHKFFQQNKSTLLMAHEIFDEHGKERNFKELRRVFNCWKMVKKG